MFKKATKKQCKLRAALFGPSGSGKTFSALRIASGMGGKIAVIDTERGSASKYSDRFDFDVCELLNKTIDGYCEAIKSANGYSILIIDSMSHGWQELLEQVEKISQSKFRGNTWSAWSEGTPLQRKLVDALLSFDGHIIATMRSKTEWTTSDGGNGKSKPVRVGLAPEQGKGIEYEFDLLLELSVDHVCNVLKDRTGKFQDKLIDEPGEEFGKQLNEWLNSGEIPEKQEIKPNENIEQWEDLDILSISENKPTEAKPTKFYFVKFNEDREAWTSSAEIKDKALEYMEDLKENPVYNLKAKVEKNPKTGKFKLVGLYLNNVY